MLFSGSEWYPQLVVCFFTEFVVVGQTVMLSWDVIPEAIFTFHELHCFCGVKSVGIFPEASPTNGTPPPPPPQFHSVVCKDCGWVLSVLVPHTILFAVQKNFIQLLFCEERPSLWWSNFLSSPSGVLLLSNQLHEFWFWGVPSLVSRKHPLGMPSQSFIGQWCEKIHLYVVGRLVTTCFEPSVAQMVVARIVLLVVPFSRKILRMKAHWKNLAS